MAARETLLAVNGVVLALAVLANLIFTGCLIHTWKHWRKVKLYITVLLAANWIEVFFVFALRIGMQTHRWEGSNAACKFVMFLFYLGPTLAAMAVAAMSFHVLVTAITGYQGNRRRHVVTIGLLVLLSLPYPVSRLFLAGVNPRDNTCKPTISLVWYDGFGVNITQVLFPCFVFLCCLLPAVFLIKSKGNVKGDESLSDVVISVLLGVAFLVTCLPYGTLILIQEDNGIFSKDTRLALVHLADFRNILSGLAVVVFAYIGAFRCCEIAPVVDSNGDERQKLVN